MSLTTTFVTIILLFGMVSLAAGLLRPRAGLLLPIALIPLVNLAVGRGDPGWTLSSGKVFIVAFVFSSAVWWFRRRPTLNIPPGLKAVVALYFTAALASSWLSGSLLKYGWWYLAKEAGYALVFVGALAALTSPGERRRAVVVLVAVGGMVAALWHVQFWFNLTGLHLPLVLWRGTGYDQFVAAGSTIGHQNYYGTYIIIVLAVTLGWMKAQGWRGNLLWLLTLLEASSLLLSGSVGAVAAFGLVLACWWLVRRVGVRFAGAVAGGVLGVGVALGVALPAKYVPCVPIRVPSVLSRVHPISVAAHSVQSRPTLGHGPGSFGSVLREYERRLPREGRLPRFRKSEGTSSHNSYLEATVEKGLVGLVLLCAILLGLIGPLLRPDLEASGHAGRNFGQWIGVGLLAAAFQGLTENVLTHTTVMTLFLFATALAWRETQDSGTLDNKTPA